MFLQAKLGSLSSGDSDSLGFAELRHNAELLHKTQSVPVHIAFEHFAVRKEGNAYTGDVELLACWGNAV
jgi:hypothetical protein